MTNPDRPSSCCCWQPRMSAAAQSSLLRSSLPTRLRASNFDPGVGLSYVAFLRRRGSIQRAEDVLTDLASRQPKNLAILSALAEVKLTRQDWAGAQEIGEAIRRIGNSNGIADQILGAALSGQHKYDESIAAFQNAVAAAPSAVQPMVSLVRALVRAKQTDRAVSFLQSVLKVKSRQCRGLCAAGFNTARKQCARSGHEELYDGHRKAAEGQYRLPRSCRSLLSVKRTLMRR